MDWSKTIEEIRKIQKEPPAELIRKYLKRTIKHIWLMNQYSKKLSNGVAMYPKHDIDKLDALLKGYCYYSKENRTDTEQRLLDICTLVHVKTSPHHPEYWTDVDLTDFTRDNPAPNGIMDISKMPKKYLREMCCDWCAVSHENGSTPFEWYKKVNGIRWKFTEEQQKYILNILKKLWC